MPARRRRDTWLVQYENPDPSRDGTLSYENRARAVEAAARFARRQAERELDDLEWDPGEEAPELLREVIALANAGLDREAVLGWLEYQSEYDPPERIKIGPRGFLSDQPHDFEALVEADPEEWRPTR